MADRSTEPEARASMPSAQDRVVTLGDLRFHYRDWGDPAAPPLVLVHGYTWTARQLDPLAHALSDRYRVVVLDQRGHGESGRATDGDYRNARFNDDFAAFVEALALPPFVALGYLFGGHILVSYAVSQPERIQRMALVESFTAPDTPAVHAFYAAFMALGEEFATPDEALHKVAAAKLAPFATDDALQHWIQSGIVQRPDGRWTWLVDPVLKQPNTTGMTRFTLTPDALWQLLPQVRCPTLLVRGVTSDFTTSDTLEQAVALMPNARALSLPEAGVWTPLDNPGGLAQVVRDFLTAG
jgi:pimeloyl-ACP methyl ester carboxylesterase